MRAIDLFRSNRETIDLVVVDLTMPQRSGMEVLRAIRSIDPGMRVILSSGTPRPSRFQERRSFRSRIAPKCLRRSSAPPSTPPAGLKLLIPS